MKALFIEYPKCTTCKKALKYLEENNVEVTKRHIVEEVPTKEELTKWIDASGLELKKFFNTSGMLYREMGLKDRLKDLSKEEAIALLASNGMLIKRPMLITQNHILLGFKEASYKEVIQEEQ